MEKRMIEYKYGLAKMRALGRRFKMRTNMDALRGKMAEKRIGNEEMAKRIGVDPSTFYRKIRLDGIHFTVGQMHKIVEVLELTNEEATAIFLL